MVKQKLVRLTATSQDLIGKQCIFEATYNDGILIDENSQIALLSATLSRSIDSLVVNSFNDLITFQTATGLTHEVFIPHGNYDGNAFNRLLDGIQDGINEEFNILTGSGATNSREQGMHVDVAVNDQNAVQIDIIRSKQINGLPTAAIPANGVGIGNQLGWYYSLSTESGISVPQMRRQVVNSTGTLFVNDGVVQEPMSALNGTSSYVYSSIPFTKGCGQLAVQIDNFLTQDLSVAPGGSGIMVGLLVKTDSIMRRLMNQSSPDDRIKPHEFAYGVSTNNNGSNLHSYQVKRQGIAEFLDTTINPHIVSTASHRQDQCDIFSIRLTKGRISIKISDLTMADASSPYYNEKGRTIYLGDYQRRDSNGNEIEYIPYVGFYGTKDYTRVGRILCSLNTDADNAEFLTEDATSGDVGAGADPKTPLCVPLQTASKFNIIFAKESIANFLGFAETNLSPGLDPKVLPPVTFVAESPRSKIYNTNTYLVEMLSELVDSYDSFQQGRKNILAPIPISERTINAGTGIVQYQPNNLVFVDLKNSKERLIRNMRARIITDTYDTIEIEGLAELNLLIRSP